MAHIILARLSNRQLYRPSDKAEKWTGNYANFKVVKRWIAEGHTIEVYDQLTGDDLTQDTLLSIVSRFGVPLPFPLVYQAIRKHSEGKISYG